MRLGSAGPADGHSRPTLDLEQLGPLRPVVACGEVLARGRAPVFGLYDGIPILAWVASLTANADVRHRSVGSAFGNEAGH